MSDYKAPRLRSADKIEPPYPLNRFPANFPLNVGRQIVYSLATKPSASIEGPEWEQIFANAIGATWAPSNIGLDDVIQGVCAWGAKTVKNRDPHKAKRVRLVSGRNSPAYSFSQMSLDADAEVLGKAVLGIWNARVESVRSRFSHVRTVVLIKSSDLTKVSIFELETIMYPSENYHWQRNKRGNLEGFSKISGEHKFTWQPHGSQFTIVETVPDVCLMLRIKNPGKISEEAILKQVGFDKNWIEVVKRDG